MNHNNVKHIGMRLRNRVRRLETLLELNAPRNIIRNEIELIAKASKELEKESAAPDLRLV